MITKDQVEGAFLEASQKIKKWETLMKMDAEEVVKDEQYAEKYDLAKSEAIAAGDSAKKLLNDFQSQSSPQ
jgi:hypothetical protein